jgi:quinolinate synthase
MVALQFLLGFGPPIARRTADESPPHLTLMPFAFFITKEYFRCMNTQLVAEINALKKSKNAQILAHFYEEGDIQEIADEVGDSLYLAQVGQKSQADVILLAGVVFMAESVKMLSPQKHVLVPDLSAGCSLVDSSPAAEYKAWREKYPEHLCITYINCSASVKAISDVICTSSNAEKIINAIPKSRGILFGPDKNLGAYLAKKMNRPMVLWQGSCEVHVQFSAQKIYELKQKTPGALLIAHPECDDSVLVMADVIGSTSRLLKEVEENKSCKHFIVATEDGIFHQMKKVRPDAILTQAPNAEGTCGCNQCPYMKKNTLEKIKHALQFGTPEVSLDPVLAAKARVSLERMMAITDGKSVTWPERFQS